MGQGFGFMGFSRKENLCALNAGGKAWVKARRDWDVAQLLDGSPSVHEDPLCVFRKACICEVGEEDQGSIDIEPWSLAKVQVQSLSGLHETLP